jgi:hypothetical protein
MVWDIPPSPRFSTRTVLAIGICSDALSALLCYVAVSDNHAFRDAQTRHLLPLLLTVTVALGLVGTFVGAGMWARKASTGAVGTLVFGTLLAILIYGNRVSPGMPDLKMLPFPLATLLIASVIIGRIVGHAQQSRLP